ncbi:MAG: acyl-CoA dehydrogenase [Jatrophihabitans sp.]|nr:MAG: acyl-CoA dehydrogenase [Jatrophihabitans sp.]
MASRSTNGRDAMGLGLAALNRVAGLPIIDRLKLRRPAERAVYQAAKSGFRAVGAANRTFATVVGRGGGSRPVPAVRRELFDLTPTDEQAMIVEATGAFAADLLRPAAAQADSDCAAPAAVLARAAGELGITQLGIPEDLGGMGGERSATTGVLVGEALAHGDMGLAVACLAPAAVSTALVLWGDEGQQQTYLPAFVGSAGPPDGRTGGPPSGGVAGGGQVPAAALAVLEPHVLFDPFTLRTTARASGPGFIVDGVKSLVPRAHDAELFVVAAMLDGEPRLFLVESGTAGVRVESEPAMGLRAASMARLVLEGVTLPGTALLGTAQDYRACIRLGRLGWAALALGTGRAVLDYVIPYVNERHAFGEPISNRQAVAFKVADIGTELEGARLVTLRAAGRAEQGMPYAREAALARRLTAEYGMRIGSDGVQLLGGHGYVKEHPVERWYRDLRAAGVMEGVVMV